MIGGFCSADQKGVDFTFLRASPGSGVGTPGAGTCAFAGLRGEG